MTDKQIRWAKQHDWFVAVCADGESILAVDIQYHRDGTVTTDSVAFRDFYKLRNWAGY